MSFEPDSRSVSEFAPIAEPARLTPVAWHGDLVILGGSCTGVFAAVRAARLGLSVAIVEQNVILGGMATAAQVTEWHSLRDVHHQQAVIGGLTVELLERLKLRGAVREFPPGRRAQFQFNSAEMAAELDELVRGLEIRVFFGARGVSAQLESGKVTALLLEDRSGRRALTAPYFIDASGDGALVRAAGIPMIQTKPLQPTSLQALVSGVAGVVSEPGRKILWEQVRARAEAAGYPKSNGTPWWQVVPGIEELINVYGPRVSGVDGSDADAYSAALMEGRVNIRRILEAVQLEFGVATSVAAWPHALGVRQTWHAICEHRLTGDELLTGAQFSDSIAQGTYPIDIHHPGGTLLRYLDGREEVVHPNGQHEWRRWREEGTESPLFYHVPYRSLVPVGSVNILVAGRLLDADREAFGGVRVMVNMNQTGEAAGTAIALALRSKLTVGEVSGNALRAALMSGGSLLV